MFYQLQEWLLIVPCEACRQFLERGMLDLRSEPFGPNLFILRKTNKQTKNIFVVKKLTFSLIGQVCGIANHNL